MASRWSSPHSLTYRPLSHCSSHHSYAFKLMSHCVLHHSSTYRPLPRCDPHHSPNIDHCHTLVHIIAWHTNPLSHLWSIPHPYIWANDVTVMSIHIIAYRPLSQQCGPYHGHGYRLLSHWILHHSPSHGLLSNLSPYHSSKYKPLSHISLHHISTYVPLSHWSLYHSPIKTTVRR